ncbi:hypothetical protein [Actinoplanes sp. NPDC051494]|uniref:hypothetical protein n=1 Tax=Actinoplanes sp. NPDC051494 TaxID=3363907 RepID=UPI003791F8B4
MTSPTHTLRVVWPIHDDGMFDREAVEQASREWPTYAEAQQVTIVGPACIRVVQLDAHQQEGLQAARAVICEAPVARRLAVAS